jgi:hypothetical protein
MRAGGADIDYVIAPDEDVLMRRGCALTPSMSVPRPHDDALRVAEV